MKEPAPEIDLDAVRSAAGGALDPEIRRSIGEMDLIDEVRVDGRGRVTVAYHLTSPLCPSQFAVQIGREVRRRVEAVDGVSGCHVLIRDHFIARDIQDRVNDPSFVRKRW